VAGDFNGDGRDDLAIGVPDEDRGNPTVSNAGGVHVLYGTAVGLRAANNQFWAQSNTQGGLESQDRFGAALAAGNFNGDANNGISIDDLAIGVPNEDLGNPTVFQAGAVNVLYGTINRLAATNN
jgi:hypothetical protein